MGTYMQNHELRVVDAELSVRNEHAPDATILRHGQPHIKLCCIFFTDNMCISSGGLLFPQATAHNCGSSADTGHTPTKQIYFRDIIQPAKISLAISA
jgi:hypothetical protein